MTQVYQALLVVHILLAASWFAARLGVAGRLRRGFERGGTAALEAIADATRQQRWAFGAGVLTLATGLGLLFLLGGFRGSPPRLHIGLALTLLALVSELVLAYPALRRLGVPAQAESGRKRLALASGLVHLLWVATLVTMVWKA